MINLVRKTKSDLINEAMEQPVDIILPQRLEQFTNQYTREQLYTMLTEQIGKLAGKVVESELDELAATSVINEIRKLNKKSTYVPKAKATSFIGIIVGDGGLNDKIATIRSIANAIVKRDGRSSAIDQGYIDGDGATLDTRQKIFGKENEGYGLPLDDRAVDCSRTLNLIAKLDGREKYCYGTIQTNDAPLARGWAKIRFFTPCQSFGIVKKEQTNGEFNLNSSQAEETTSVFKGLKEDMDVKAVFMEAVGSQIIEVDQVEREAELIKVGEGKYPYDAHFFVRGKVSWITRDRPDYFGNVRMGIMNDSGVEIMVSMPKNIPKDFGELSEVVVIGRPARGDLAVQDEDSGKTIYQKRKGDIFLNAMGVFVLKATPEDLFSGEQLGDSKEIEGWI